MITSTTKLHDISYILVWSFDNWEHVLSEGFEYADECRAKIRLLLDLAEDDYPGFSFYVNKCCVMQTGEFYAGNNLAIADYLRV